MSTQPMSPGVHSAKPNGETEAPGAEANEEYPEQKYAPEDFSQLAINRGQRMINYELTVADYKLVKVLEALKDAIRTAPSLDKVKFDAVDDAISEARKAIKKVAGIIPPGCLGPN